MKMRYAAGVLGATLFLTGCQMWPPWHHHKSAPPADNKPLDIYNAGIPPTTPPPSPSSPLNTPPTYYRPAPAPAPAVVTTPTLPNNPTPYIAPTPVAAPVVVPPPAPAPATVAPVNRPPPVVATPSKPVIKPDLRASGQVEMVNTEGRFAIVTFPPGSMPPNGTTLGIYREGAKVGELKITGPQRENDTVADIVNGDIKANDDAKAQ